jgi:hypothetical protein
MLMETRADPADPKAKQARAKAEAKTKGKPGGDDDPAAVAMDDGATAFQWSDRLDFDQSRGQAVMDGAVVVTHQPDKPGEPPVRVDADRLTATFESPEEAKKQPEAGSEQVAAAGADGGPRLPKLKIKSFAALGNIVISRDGAELAASRLDYDPATDWVIARGQGRSPAIFTHPSGKGSATASELWLNTHTWQVKVVNAAARGGG